MTPSAMTLFTSVSLTLFVAGASDAQVSQSRVSPATVEKHHALDEVVESAMPIPTEELVGVVRKGFADSDRTIRSRALSALVARAASPKNIDAWRQERSAFNQLRPDVYRLLADPASQVRASAIQAACSLDIDQERRSEGGARQLSPATVSAFAARVGVETADVTRGLLVKAFADYKVAPDTEAQRNAIVSKALRDPTMPVLHAALLAVSQQQIASLLPAAAAQINHAEPQVRVVAAQAVASFGTTALPYVPQLRAALEKEPDDLAKKTFEGSITRITTATR